MKRAYIAPFLAFALLLQLVPLRSAGAPTPMSQTGPVRLTPAQRAQGAQIRAKAQAGLKALSAKSQQRFLAYRSRFQLGQIDRHVKLLNAALQRCANCRPVLQRQIVAATTLRAGIAQTMRPVAKLGLTYVGHAPGGVQYFPHKSPTAGPSCPVPHITSLSVNLGQPGDPVVISGSGFGNPTGTVQFIGSGGSIIAAGSSAWIDTQILTNVPALTGVQSFTGYFQVTPTCQQGTSTQNSNVQSFQFSPEPDTMQLPISPSNATWGDFTCGVDSCGSGAGGMWCAWPQACDVVIAGFITGKRGADQFFQGYQLKNGWTLASVDFATQPVNTSANGCSIGSGGTIGSASPFVDVACWVTPNYGVTGYTLSLYITGPTGVPYQ
jgi:hypothetical protein